MAKVQKQLISSQQIIYFISACCTEVKCLRQVLLRRVILFSLNFWLKAGRPSKIGSMCQGGPLQGQLDIAMAGH